VSIALLSWRLFNRCGQKPYRFFRGFSLSAVLTTIKPVLAALSGNSARISEFQTWSSLSRIRPLHLGRLVTDLMMKHPVYRVRPSQLVVLGTDIEVEAIDVLQDGVLLKFRKANPKVK